MAGLLAHPLTVRAFPSIGMDSGNVRTAPVVYSCGNSSRFRRDSLFTSGILEDTNVPSADAIGPSSLANVAFVPVRSEVERQ